jgi:hypothetical protein
MWWSFYDFPSIRFRERIDVGGETLKKQLRNKWWLNWDWSKVLERVVCVNIAMEVGTLIRAIDFNVAEAKKRFRHSVVKASCWENSTWHWEWSCQEQKRVTD